MNPLRRPLVVIATASLLAACATPSPTPSADASSPPTASPSGSARPSASVVPAPSASPSASAIADEPPAIDLEVVAEGLLDPIGILGAPDGTLLVNERAGRILALDPDGGEAAYEEIDRIDPKTQGGANLGWDVLEATHCYTSPNCEAIGIPPVAEYPHEFGCSVTGGYVYRGDEIPDLWGWYLFSDYCTGNVFAVRSDVAQTETTPRVLLETDANASSFGVDADGELYLADIGSGRIYRVVADGG